MGLVQFPQWESKVNGGFHSMVWMPRDEIIRFNLSLIVKWLSDYHNLPLRTILAVKKRKKRKKNLISSHTQITKCKVTKKRRKKKKKKKIRTLVFLSFLSKRVEMSLFGPQMDRAVKLEVQLLCQASLLSAVSSTSCVLEHSAVWWSVPLPSVQNSWPWLTCLQVGSPAY